MSAAGQNVRKYYQRRLPSNPDLDYYYILRETPNNESIIVEYGFADSTGDDVNQLKNNWQDLTEAVVKSLAEYVGVPYKPIASADSYIVKSGDTLWSIARNNGLTVDELKRINNLSNNALSIGQVLKLKPSTSGGTETYTVKSGDTLYGIAKPSNTGENDNNNYYVVKSGDNLYKIANLYDTDVSELKRLNNLTSNTLSIGQRLIVPSKKDYQTYTVKSGDTLYGIARDFNTTVSAIQSLNNLATSNLSIGQKLLIP